MRLLIVSHVIHFRHEGRLYAYGPYVREIDVWAELFPEVMIASPCRDAVPPGDCLPFESSNISIAPQMETGGETWWSKVKLAAATPLMMLGVAREAWRSDAVHVRCPGNLGLIGTLVAPLFCSRLVAKYAAQWDESADQPWGTRLQKGILRSRWWRGPVTVYGEWPNQPPHIISFFTSLLTGEMIARARVAAVAPRPASGMRILYTGRLSKSKNVDTLIRAVAECLRTGREVTCTVVGDGPEREHLEALSESFGAQRAVKFAGAVAFEKVIDHLEQSDALVLVSETEGWPKAIAEAMAFGLVCVGSDTGFLPRMLDGRGFVVPPGDAEALTKTLFKIYDSPDRCADIRGRASEWAQRFSLSGLRDAIRSLLEEKWSVQLGTPVQHRIDKKGTESQWEPSV